MAIQRKKRERAVIPGDRPLRALTREELVARFESALIERDGIAGAHCIHELWMRNKGLWTGVQF